MIKAFGIGGAGCNALNRLSPELGGLSEVWAVDTDAQALALARTEQRLQLGMTSLRGLSAQDHPKSGFAAAREDRQALETVCTDAELVVFIAGLGGGTGSGVAPVVAEVARKRGALVVALVTLPFAFEDRRRRQQADACLGHLREYVDLVTTPSAQADGFRGNTRRNRPC